MLDQISINQVLRGLWIVVVAVASILLLYFSIPLLYPFIIGWIIAFLLQPVVGWFERRLKTPKWLAVTLSLLLFIGALAGLISLLVTRMVIEIQRFAHYINENYEQWLQNIAILLHSDFLQQWTEQITRLYEGSEYEQTLEQGLTSAGEKIAGAIPEMLQTFAGNIVGFLAALPNVAVGLIVALIAAFFIAKDWVRVRTWLSDKMPIRVKHAAGSVWLDLQKALFGFVRAQLILISITAVFVIIGLLLLRVPYAITIGLLIGLVDLLPYLGTGAVFVPWIIYMLLQGNYSLGIGLAVLYAIIIIARQLAEPKIYSSSIGLNPLVTLIGLFIGLKLFGFIGLIIGPVTLVLLFSFQRAGVFRDLWRYILYGRSSPE